MQLDSWIWTQLTGPAQLLAHDLMHRLHNMSYSLYTFISTSYEYTMHSSRSDSNQAWKLPSSFVKQIFTEIGYARVSGRDSINIDPPW